MHTQQFPGAVKNKPEMTTPAYRIYEPIVSESQDQMKEGHTHKADLALARKIQTAMIPQVLPAADGLSMESMYLPCPKIKGDQYDVVQLSDKVFAFLIFDVTGHGVSSALISSLSRVLFTHQLHQGNSPRAVIERVNRELIQTMKTDFYLTAFVGYLDLHDNCLTYSNAGHAYPWVYRSKTEELMDLKTQGTCVGLFENGFYEEQSIILDPEDWIIMFTDGIYRVFSDQNSRVGRELMKNDTITAIKNSSPKEFIKKFKMKTVTSQADNEDDITALAVKLEPDTTREELKRKLNFSSCDSVYIQFVRFYEEIDRAVGTVLGAMDKAGYGDDSIRAMKISLPELILNAINHGNQRDYFKKVIVGHVVTPKEAVVSVFDEGEGFDPFSIPDPTLEENIMKDSGRGIFIAKNYSDRIEWNESGNRVTITVKHEKHKGEK
ncbi:MAG: SpoIIE family protein phosphatase [Chitinispirillaceae bacterium]